MDRTGYDMKHNAQHKEICFVFVFSYYSIIDEESSDENSDVKIM